jgi:hypothetical protein
MIALDDALKALRSTGSVLLLITVSNQAFSDNEDMEACRKASAVLSVTPPAGHWNLICERNSQPAEFWHCLIGEIQAGKDVNETLPICARYQRTLKSF